VLWFRECDSEMADVSSPKSEVDFVNQASARFWASTASESVLDALMSRPEGLSSAEVKVRLVHFGPNTLPQPARRRWYIQLALNFIHLFALLLWAELSSPGSPACQSWVGP